MMDILIVISLLILSYKLVEEAYSPGDNTGMKLFYIISTIAGIIALMT